MSEPIRILHVFGQLNMGGAESRIMDLYRSIDRERVQFDFVIHTDEHCFYDDEARSLGARIFRLPRFRVYNYREYQNAWRTFLREHEKGQESEFAMIQGHMTSTAAIYLPIAKECNIRHTIAHARSAGVDAGIKGYITRFLRRNLASEAEFLFTCSQKAGISVFGRKAVEEGRTKFIPNAIDTGKFAFDINKRKEIRKALGIDDRFVIGHVGRFHYAKNHEYLLKIFRDLCEDWITQDIITDDMKIFTKPPVLLLVGEGPRMSQMKALAIEYGIEELVLFVGNKADVYNYYRAMDYFVYPSRYEGLPGTVVEAQSAGLRILMSDSICDEVCVTDLVGTMSIEAVSDEWAVRVMEEARMGLSSVELRDGYSRKVAEAGFDVEAQARMMTEFYENGHF